MQTASIRSLCIVAAMATSFGVIASPVFAQGAGTLPSIKDSKGDTLKMTCGEARSLVHGGGGTLLTSGPNHYDVYHRGGAACERENQETQPAFVRTRDNPLCFVGYTCEDTERSSK